MEVIKYFLIHHNSNKINNGAKLGVAAVARAPPLFLPRPEFILISAPIFLPRAELIYIHAPPLLSPDWRH